MFQSATMLSHDLKTLHALIQEIIWFSLYQILCKNIINVDQSYKNNKSKRNHVIYLLYTDILADIPVQDKIILNPKIQMQKFFSTKMKPILFFCIVIFFMPFLPNCHCSNIMVKWNIKLYHILFKLNLYIMDAFVFLSKIK